VDPLAYRKSSDLAPFPVSRESCAPARLYLQQPWIRKLQLSVTQDRDMALLRPSSPPAKFQIAIAPLAQVDVVIKGAIRVSFR